MMKLKNIFFFLFLSIAIWSCKKDDDGSEADSAPPRELSEVAVEDDAELIAFLKTHFYNYEEFQNPPVDFDYRIRFDTIAGDNADKIAIFDSGQLSGVVFGSETITVSSAEFGRTDGEIVDHKLYYLVAREGGSELTPTIGDDYVVRYEGSLLNGTVFESVVSQPVKFNLSQVVRGFGNGLRFFKTGTEAVENGDGTFTYDDYGIGAIFMPSGLGYFSLPPRNTNLIQSYTPLIFKVDAFVFEKDTDLDEDGIPSILEDLNKDGNLNNDNTDSADEVGSFVPNYQDSDDDNDGIPTIEEINLKADGSFDSFRFTVDSDIPDHLNPDQLDN